MLSSRETMEDARSELADLRMVPGEKAPAPQAQALCGQKRAMEYLGLVFDASRMQQLLALGPSMVGAIFAALGPAYFELAAAGRRMLLDAFSDAEESGADALEIDWDALRPHLVCGSPVSDLLAACAAGSRDDADFMAYAVAVAAKLVERDKLRTLLGSLPQPEEAKAETKVADQGSEAAGTGASPAPKTKALALREARDMLLDPRVGIAEVGKKLLSLPVPSRALAISSAFQGEMDRVSPKEADGTAEKLGRRLERALDETGRGQRATLAALIRAGDIYVVLSMVRGEAGEFSSTAEHLTPELVGELLANDPDMNDPERRRNRLLTICHTLLVETKLTSEAINKFFASRDGQRWLWQILAVSSRMADPGDETADTILRFAELERGIPIPSEPDEIDVAEDAEDDEADDEEEDDPGPVARLDEEEDDEDD